LISHAGVDVRNEKRGDLPTMGIARNNPLWEVAGKKGIVNKGENGKKGLTKTQDRENQRGIAREKSKTPCGRGIGVGKDNGQRTIKGHG